MVVVVSELAKRSDRAGALVASLPLVTILTLLWLYAEKQPMSKLCNHAFYTFWYVIPTLPMFLLFPYILPKCGFWASLAICAAFTAFLFFSFALGLRRFGVQLM